LKQNNEKPEEIIEILKNNGFRLDYFQNIGIRILLRINNYNLIIFWGKNNSEFQT